MTTSLIAALGAMRAHQSWLDVIGNNLANSNTPGFKSSRVLFSDILSVTFRPAHDARDKAFCALTRLGGVGVRIA